MIEIMSAEFLAINGDKYLITKVMGFWTIEVVYFYNGKVQNSRYNYPSFDSAKNHAAIHFDSGVWIDPNR